MRHNIAHSQAQPELMFIQTTLLFRAVVHVRNQIIPSDRNYINPPVYWRVMTAT